MQGKMEFPPNRTRKLLADGGSAYGTFAVLGEPALIEMIGYAGFDFVVIDTEHSGNTTEQVGNMIRASEVAKSTPIVRVTTNSPELILRALDAGAGGVLVPQVNTAAEATAAVQAARYAPLGERGIAGVVRAARYGFIPMPDYLAGSNRENLVITQVEHALAVKNIDSILAVEGLDGIFIGPTDLSQSMGITGQFSNPELRRTIHSVIEKTRRTDKWAGIFCLNAEDAAYWKAAGAQFLTIATEGMIFASALRSLKEQLQPG
jgi:4-hydroxy-2-oxoheptanedioate aldolase